jgi:membrane fusion protein (multidrug efflux system)
MKRPHLVVAAVGIALAGTAAWWWQHRASPAAVVAGDAGTPAAPGGASSGIGGGGPQGPAGTNGRSAADGPVAVEAGKVQAVRIADDAQAVGSVRARQNVVLRPEVSGRIKALGFADGQRVRRGQLLVQLDDTLQLAQLQQAQAQAAIARTNLQRSRELAEQNFVSQSAVDQNAAALEVAQAQVALAQAQLTRMRIVAPFDAVAGIRSVNVGDYLKDGADIVALEDTSAVWIDFRLPERFIARARAGQEVEVRLDALPGREYRARVEALDSLVDAGGRSLLVRARLPNPDGQLKSGLFARARIVFGVRENALVVPEEALVPLGAQQFLVRIVDGPDGAKISQRLEARVGTRLAGKAEILEGLKAGDLVVTAGQARLMRADGLRLRVVDIERAAGAASAAAARAPAGSAAGTGNGARTAP